jgi:hypothetical protein
MAGWLGAWLQYLGGLWVRGAFLLFVIACAAILGALVFGIALMPIAWAVGLHEPVSREELALSALVWLPVMVGAFFRTFAQWPVVRAPMSLRYWRMGQSPTD